MDGDDGHKRGSDEGAAPATADAGAGNDGGAEEDDSEDAGVDNKTDVNFNGEDADEDCDPADDGEEQLLVVVDVPKIAACCRKQKNDQSITSNVV